MKVVQIQSFNDTKNWYYSLPKRKPDGSDIADGYDGPVVRWDKEKKRAVLPRELLVEFNRRASLSERIDINSNKFTEEEVGIIHGLEVL